MIKKGKIPENTDSKNHLREKMLMKNIKDYYAKSSTVKPVWYIQIPVYPILILLYSLNIFI